MTDLSKLIAHLQKAMYEMAVLRDRLDRLHNFIEANTDRLDIDYVLEELTQLRDLIGE